MELTEEAVKEAARGLVESDEALASELAAGTLRPKQLRAKLVGALGLENDEKLLPFKETIIEVILAIKEEISDDDDDDDEDDDDEDDDDADEEDNDPEFRALPESYRERFLDVVWAKQPSFKHWPSLVYDPRWVEGSLHRQAMKLLGKKHLVMFYGMPPNERYGFADADDDMVEWEKGFEQKLDKNGPSFKPKKYAVAFPKAVDEARVDAEKSKNDRGEQQHLSTTTTTTKKKKSPSKTAVKKKAKKTTVTPPEDDDEAEDDEDYDEDDERSSSKKRKAPVETKKPAAKREKKEAPPKKPTMATKKKEAAASAAAAEDERRRRLQAAKQSGVPVWKTLASGAPPPPPPKVVIESAVEDLKGAVAGNDVVEASKAKAAIDRLSPHTTAVVEDVERLKIIADLLKVCTAASDLSLRNSAKVLRGTLKKLHKAAAASALMSPKNPTDPPKPSSAPELASIPPPPDEPSKSTPPPAESTSASVVVPPVVRRPPLPPAQRKIPPNGPPPKKKPDAPSDPLAAAFGR